MPHFGESLLSSGVTISAPLRVRSPVYALGYVRGSGGAVTQLVNKSTGVTLDANCGDITMNNAALAADTAVSFTLTNSSLQAADVLILNQRAGTDAAYVISGRCQGGAAVITVRNITAGSLSEAIVIRFVRITSTNT